MTFTLSVSDPFYDQGKEKLYHNLGFFTKDGMIIERDWDNGKILNPTIEIRSLEELLNFENRVGNPLIIRGTTIEIYNGYRE